MLRRRTVLDLLGIHNATLSNWIAGGRFPPPVVLNPGAQKRSSRGPKNQC
jgi:predicted DNA-binding transcriptional regulator AlpA